MAGDWIKMRVDLADDPAVIAIASRLKVSENEVVGCLHRLWSWADRHTEDGTVTMIDVAWVDGYVKRRGFADALEAAGWLRRDGDGFLLPGFQKHNGETAKTRALATRRKKQARSDVTILSRKQRDKNGTENGQNCDESATREEKRRDSLTPSGFSPPPSVTRPGQKPDADKSAKGEKPGATIGDWWRSNPGIEAKGREVGLEPKVGELHGDYKRRIFDELAARERRTA